MAEEKKEAGAEEEESAGVYVLKLAKPFTWEGKTYEELTFDFTTLTGLDSIAVSAEMEGEGARMGTLKELNPDYQARIAARACREKAGSDVLTHLPILEFNRICNRTRNFLIGLG